MNMAKFKKATENLGDDSVAYDDTEAASAPRIRRPSVRKDPATMSPLEAKLHKVKQSYRLLELAKGLDPEALTELMTELGKLQASPTE
jgi:hypothetical protein